MRMNKEELALITLPISDYKNIFIKIETLTARITELETHIHALEAHQLDDTARLAREIAFDRQRLAKLEKVEPQPLQRDRGEILRALIAANGGKMLAKDARQKMHLSLPLFSMLLATMKEDIEVKPYHLKRNQKLLILR